MEEYRSRRMNPKNSRNEHSTRVSSPRERELNRGRNEDRYRERERRYRSRSRDSRSERRSRRNDDRDERGARYRDRERDRDRDRDRDGRHDNGNDRGRNRERHNQKDIRESQRERSRSRRRIQDGRDKGAPDKIEKRDTRSRSPLVERSAAILQEKPSNSYDNQRAEQKIAPPPVSFKVGSNQEPDRMDIDGTIKKLGSEKTSQHPVAEFEEVEEEVVIEEENEVTAMKAMMGFGNFSTTHQKKVPGNNVSAVRKEKKTEYRQYMNRVGGFNRPLSPSR